MTNPLQMPAILAAVAAAGRRLARPARRLIVPPARPRRGPGATRPEPARRRIARFRRPAHRSFRLCDEAAPPPCSISPPAASHDRGDRPGAVAGAAAPRGRRPSTRTSGWCSTTSAGSPPTTASSRPARWPRAPATRPLVEVLHQAVRRRGPGRGLSEARWTATHRSAPVGAAVPAVLIAVVFMLFERRRGLRPVGAFLAGTVLPGPCLSSCRRRSTASAARARARGGRALAGPAGAPGQRTLRRPAGRGRDDLGTRPLAYAAALGLADRAVVSLPISSPADDSRAWSDYGGMWHLVDVATAAGDRSAGCGGAARSGPGSVRRRSSASRRSWSRSWCCC